MSGCNFIITDLDQDSKMIIFESILTTLTESVDLEAVCWWSSVENWLKLKIDSPLANKACLNW
jgi:hypothetical protein